MDNNLQSFYRLLQDQNLKAFSDFYDQYAGALYGEAVRKLEDAERAEKVLLEVFMKAFKELPRFDFENRGLFTWMLLLTRGHVNALRFPVRNNE